MFGLERLRDAHCIPSLIPQRHQRVHFRRPPRRDVTCEQRHAGEQQCDNRKRRRISRAHAKQQARHQARQREGSRQTNHLSDQDQGHTLPYHQSEHISLSCAQSHTDADLVGSLRDGIGHDAVDAHGGQDQSRDGQRPIRNIVARGAATSAEKNCSMVLTR